LLAICLLLPVGVLAQGNVADQLKKLDEDLGQMAAQIKKLDEEIVKHPYSAFLLLKRGELYHLQGDCRVALSELHQSQKIPDAAQDDLKRAKENWDAALADFD